MNNKNHALPEKSVLVMRPKKFSLNLSFIMKNQKVK